MKIEMAQQFFVIFSVSNFIKIGLSVLELFHVYRQTEGRSALSETLSVSFNSVSNRKEGGKAASMTRSAHALLNTTVQNNISPLYAQCEQCARLTMKTTPTRRMFSGW
jgi:hypothetical protein